jgi:hypothetical protein
MRCVAVVCVHDNARLLIQRASKIVPLLDMHARLVSCLLAHIELHRL